mmetsp:Transcript_23600/g.59314  ORF Transcript_23600/g.59314 Transcript_23600/m.59314 type:complete len:292 (+) Transcript_23600:276-1151(+)
MSGSMRSAWCSGGCMDTSAGSMLSSVEDPAGECGTQLSSTCSPRLWLSRRAVNDTERCEPPSTEKRDEWAVSEGRGARRPRLPLPLCCRPPDPSAGPPLCGAASVPVRGGRTTPVMPFRCESPRDSSSHSHISVMWCTCSISYESRMPSLYRSFASTHSGSMWACTPLPPPPPPSASSTSGRRNMTAPGRACSAEAAAPRSARTASAAAAARCASLQPSRLSCGTSIQAACSRSSALTPLPRYLSRTTRHLFRLHSAKQRATRSRMASSVGRHSRGTRSFPATTDTQYLAM